MMSYLPRARTVFQLSVHLSESVAEGLIMLGAIQLLLSDKDCLLLAVIRGLDRYNGCRVV